MEIKKIPIEIANDTHTWFKIRIQPCFLQFIQANFNVGLTTDGRVITLAFSRTENTTGVEEVKPNTKGVLAIASKQSEITTSGGYIFSADLLLKLWNHQFTEPTDIYVGVYQNSGGSDTKASLFLYYSKEKLTEVLN